MSYRTKPSLERPTLSQLHFAMTRSERLLFWIAILNFGAFIIMTLVLGGDAINGTAANGHYYLMSHGKYTEVGRGLFEYSIVHALSQIVTMPVAAVVLIRARLRWSNPPTSETT